MEENSKHVGILTVSRHGKTIAGLGSDPQATLFRGVTTWKDTQRHASKDTAKLANTRIPVIVQNLHCMDDHQFFKKKEELETAGQVSEVCSQIVACGKRLAKLISAFALREDADYIATWENVQIQNLFTPQTCMRTDP